MCSFEKFELEYSSLDEHKHRFVLNEEAHFTNQCCQHFLHHFKTQVQHRICAIYGLYCDQVEVAYLYTTGLST